MIKINLKNNESLIIREATKADALALIAYVKKVSDETNFLTFNSSEFNKTQKEEEKFIEFHQKSSNMIFLLAEINQEIIGILNVHSSHKKRLQHIGELGISVLKNHWNKGIGKHLMDKMIKWAKSSGTIRKINLSVQANNSIAIKLYNNFGFIEEGRLKRGAYINGKFHDEILMGLLI